QKTECQERADDFGFAEKAQIGRAACIEDGTQTIAKAGKDKSAGNDADESGGSESGKRDAKKGRRKINQPKGKSGHEAQKEKIAEGILAEAFFHTGKTGTCLGAQEIGKGGARGDE